MTKFLKQSFPIKSLWHNYDRSKKLPMATVLLSEVVFFLQQRKNLLDRKLFWAVYSTFYRKGNKVPVSYEMK